MRKAALYGLIVVCVCLMFALSKPSAVRAVTGIGSGGMPTTGNVSFVGVTTETFPIGIGALVASRACNTERPQTRLCEWADVFRSIPPPIFDTDVLIAQNYEVNPRTTCITSDGGLKCKPDALLPAACCGSPIQILLNIDTTSSGCSSSTLLMTSCSQTICFRATVLDHTGKGIAGVALFFTLQNTVSQEGSTFNATFNPSAVATDSSGDGFSQLTPDSTCPAQCAQSSGRTCTAQVIAATQGGAIQSSPLQLQTNIP
jgi:hypothetical protein